MKRWSEVLSGKKLRRKSAAGRDKRKSAERQGMYLASLRRTVPAAPSLLTPDMRVVVVEDLWWSMENQVWTDGKPPLWRRKARIEWRARGQELAEKQQRIRALAGS